MSCLHTLSKAPSSGLLQQCLPLLSSGDALLLLEDGVYCAMDAASLAGIQQGVSVYALREDLQARGILNRCVDSVTSVSNKRFVELCCRHERLVNWF